MTAIKPDSAPLISVILPTFNAGRWVATALESLAAQRFRDFEVLVSDGVSTDDTLRVVDGWRDKLPALTVSSRPDRGVYDAMNIAWAQCRGRWVFVLGSDDKLHAPDTLEQVVRTLTSTTASIAYGDVRVIGSNAMVADGARYGGAFTLARLMGQNICQQAVFYRREVWGRLGGFDLRLRLWADWDFAQRAFVGEPTVWMDVVVADYAASGMSSGHDDEVFVATRQKRLLALWRMRPFSLAVPAAFLRNAYWNWRKRGAAQVSGPAV